MEENSFNDKSGLNGSSGTHGLSGTRPKFQPVRIKALLDLWGSDDEDSEDKESDSDDVQPLEQDNQLWDTRGESARYAKDAEHRPNDVPDTVLDTTIGTNIGAEPVPRFKNKEQAKDKSIVPTTESLPGKREVATSQEKFEDSNHGGCANSRSKNILQPEKGFTVPSATDLPSSQDHVARYEDNRSSYDLETSIDKNHAILHAKNDVEISREEQKPYNRYSGVKDRSDSRHSAAGVDNIARVAQTSSSVRQSYGNHCNAGEKSQRLTEPQQSDVKAPSSAADFSCPATAGHSVTDTPLKHPPSSSLRPVPSLSHRCIFNTPQTKSCNDVSRSDVQTPATIFSNWAHRNILQTPTQDHVSTTGEQIQTPRYSIQPPDDPKGKSLRFANAAERPVRWPLTDTMQSKQATANGDNISAHSVDSRINPPQKLKPVDVQKTPIELGKDPSTTEDAPLHGVTPITATREMKENVHPNKPLEVAKRDVIAQKNDNNLVAHRRSNAKDGERASEKESVPDKMAKVQYSVMSSNWQARRGQTLTVKGKSYLILGKLGQGMSGEVLRVQDMACGELRAIKCSNLMSVDKETAQGCLKEVSMLHNLQAPCVVKMFDHEFKHPMLYVVMEMGDTDLSGLLKSMAQDKRLPLTMILYYWTEMLTAVKHIHDNGVIHSDLKPANFLLVRGRLKLIDFGIASSINADMTSVVKDCPIGTLNYISPEALMDTGGNGDSPNHDVKYKINYKSDVWSLGCILYSLVYGHTPFQHIRLQWAKVNAITNPKQKISFPSTPSGNNCEPPPPILIDVMRKCLQRDPKARPTVAQLLQIPYLASQQRAMPVPPDIPPNILVKIKNALTENEWRYFIEALERKPL